MILSKNTKKILGIIFIIIFILLFLFILSRKPEKDNFIDECNYRNNICKPLSLVNVNFIINRRVNNTFTKDLVYNRGKFYTMDKNYYLVIDRIQPYGAGNKASRDIDEIYKLKQSNKYIFALNKGRNQIKFSLKDFNNKSYYNMFLNKIQKVNIDDEKLNIITAYGAFNFKKETEINDYCFVVIKNYRTNESKLYLINTKVRNLDINNIQASDEGVELVFNLKYGTNKDLEIRGDLHIEVNYNENDTDNIIIYCNSCRFNNNWYNETDFKFSFIRFKYNASSGNFSKDDDGTFDGVYQASPSITSGLIEEINDINTKNNTILLLKIFKNFLQDLKVNYDKYSNGNEEGFNNQLSNIKTRISNNNTLIEKLNVSTEVIEDIDNLKKHKIKFYIKELNILINAVIEYIDIKGICDFSIEPNYKELDERMVYLYYKNKDSNGNNYILNRKTVKLIDLNNKYLTKSVTTNLNFTDDTATKTISIMEDSSHSEKTFIENFYLKLYEFKKHNFILNNDTIDLKYSSANINMKIIHPISELITDDNRKPDLDNYYNIDNKTISNIDFHQNLMGILDFKIDKYNSNDESELIEPLKKDNIYQPRNSIFTLYRKITNKKHADKRLYGVINRDAVEEVKYEAIPTYKYNKSLDNNKSSIFKFFVDKQRDKSLKNIKDWIYLYEVFKNQGFYYPNKNNRFDFNHINIKNSYMNNDTIINNGRFKAKHDKIFRDESFKNVYDNDNYEKFPNYYISLEPGDTLDMLDVRVKLKLRYPDELNDKQDHYIKLVNHIGDGKENNTVMHNNKAYDYFKLESKNKEDYNAETDEEKLKYTWYPKKINNFNDFAKLILDKELGDIDNENHDRDRLRGLFELDKIFVDDYYINFLEKYKSFESSSVGKERMNNLIVKKKSERDLYCILDDRGEYMINKVGYPFYVFIKYIKYHNIECTRDNIDRHTQPLFLLNRITDKHLNQDDNYIKEYESGDEFDNYPFITQEFVSFTGVGNDIQFYLKQFGGATSIRGSEIGNCRFQDFNYVDSCSDSLEGDGNCEKKVLSYIYTDGSARCEIDNPRVKRKNAAPVETLLVGSTHINACNVWMRKGDKKIYYKLGKIFENSGEIQYQLKGMFTIQTTEPEYDGKYLVYKNGNIELDENPIDDTTKEVKQEYIFNAKIETDNYGSYFLFSPKSNLNNYITHKINIFNHKLSEWMLQDKINEKADRNNRSNKYKTDTEYYSQKFNLPLALQRNIAANDGIEDEATAEQNREFITRQSVLNTLGSSELTRGDNSYTEDISEEEEKRIIEKELGYLNNYLKNLNNIAPREIENIAELEELLERTIEEVKERIVLGNKRLENVKFIIQTNQEVKNQESSLKPSDIIRNQVLNQGNLEKINMLDNNIEMDLSRDSKHIKSLEDIKNAVGKRQENTTRQRQCINVPIEEGFVNRNHYHSSNSSNEHVVDQYHTYIKNNLNTMEQRFNTKKDQVKRALDKAANISKVVKLEKGEEQMLLSQEIANKNKLDKDIFAVKNYEQEDRIRKIQDKLEEIEKLKCELGELEENDDDSNYKSIISHEDKELLNLYKIDKDEIGADEELNKNMILINGGCLTYDKENKKLDSKHCMINDETQHFGIHKIEDLNDMNRFNLKNTHLGIDKKKPYYIVNIPKLRKERHDNCGREQEFMCLHKDGVSNTLTLQNCSNIKNQKWAYSNVSKSCSK